MTRSLWTWIKGRGRVLSCIVKRIRCEDDSVLLWTAGVYHW